MDAERLLRFESFELDVRSRELRKGNNRIRLQEQPFEILRMMLERPGDVVTRDELARRLWPDGTFVDFEHSLNAAVKRLRADYLLEGSGRLGPSAVEGRERRVRITAQLVETSTESHLWTDVYERNLTDQLSVQAEVAARIAQSLAVELLPEQPVQPSHDA